MTEEPLQPLEPVESLEALEAGNIDIALEARAPFSPEAKLAVAEGGEVLFINSGWRLAVREFAQNKLAVAALGIIVFFILFCFIGPIIHPTNQTLTQPLNTNLAPGATSPLGGHAGILGTDENGFDELGRIMLGGQAALEIGFFAAFISIVIGTLYGAIAGLSGRVIDGAMMRFVDIMLSIPFYLIVLILATKYSATVVKLSLLLGVFSWLVPSRLMRGEVLTLRERDFVWAARVMGSSRTRLVYRHLIPNALSVVIVNVTFLVADSILYLAYLGYLGFGLQYPNVSWGDMLGKADTYISNGQWWLVYPVGVCLVVVVMSWNLIGDALRDAFDVRLQRR